MDKLAIRLGRNFEYKDGNIYRKSNVKNKLLTTLLAVVVVELLLMLLGYFTTDVSLVVYLVTFALTVFVSFSATPFKYEIIFDLEKRMLECRHKKFEKEFMEIKCITSISAVNNNVENALGDMMNVLSIRKRLKSFYVLIEFENDSAIYLFRGKKAQCELIRQTLVEMLNIQ